MLPPRSTLNTEMYKLYRISMDDIWGGQRSLVLTSGGRVPGSPMTFMCLYTVTCLSTASAPCSVQCTCLILKSLTPYFPLSNRIHSFERSTFCLYCVQFCLLCLLLSSRVSGDKLFTTYTTSCIPRCTGRCVCTPVYSIVLPAVYVN